MSLNLNISLESKSSANVSLSLSEDAQAIMLGSSSNRPSITSTATGPVGVTGATGANGTALITDGGINTISLADGSVTGAKIAPYSVSSSKLTTSAVTNSKILDSAVTTSKIADNAITANKIAPGAITLELIDIFADGAIKPDKLKPGSLLEGNFANGSVTASKIASNSITSDKIYPKSLGGGDIEDNVVLVGAKVSGGFQLLGNSPAYLLGPTEDTLHIQSESGLVFRIDSNNNSANSFLFKNGDDATILSVDDSGNTSFVGNVVVTGSINGVDITSLPTENTNTQLLMLDEDDMASAHAGAVPSQQSVKAYVDGKVLTNVPSGALFTDTDTIYTHPANHAISVTTGLQTALDSKVDDSQVLTDVPSGALFTDTDTVYTHPANHAISVTTGLQTALDGKVDDSQVLTDVPSGALFTDTDTVYTHPANHAISVTTGLQTALDGKVDDGQVLTDVPSGALFTDTNTVYNDTTIQAEVDLNTAKTSNIVQTTITGNAGTATALTSGSKTIAGTLDLSGSSSKLVIDNTEVAQIASNVVTIGQTNRVLKLDSSETKILSSTGIQLGHDSDTTIARSGAGTVTVAGKEIQFQGTGAGQYIEYPIRVFDSYSFYIYNDDYWYTLGTTSMALLGSSTAPGNLSSTSSKYQSRVGTYTALEACTLKKLTFTFYWSSSVVNSADIDFGFSKFTPITDGTSATITMNAITATDRNGTYTENAPYQVEFTFSGSNATFAAGDAFAFHMRTTGGSSGQRVIVYGGAVLSIELN